MSDPASLTSPSSSSAATASHGTANASAAAIARATPRQRTSIRGIVSVVAAHRQARNAAVGAGAGPREGDDPRPHDVLAGIHAFAPTRPAPHAETWRRRARWPAAEG